MKFHQLRLKDVSYSNTQLKQEDRQIKTEIGNLSTSRAKGAVIKQFVTEDNDTGRSCNNEKELFKKMQNLEFQNGLFQMQMQHIHKRKNLEDFTIRQQLSQIQQDIQSIQNRVQSVKVNNDKMFVKNKSSRKKINISSSSSSSEDARALSIGFNYKNKIKCFQIIKNYLRFAMDMKNQVDCFLIIVEAQRQQKLIQLNRISNYQYSNQQR
ncbi:unnamed protein product [Paramecium primaurelia]|uniref:Uncharacterized protein n=1 Tax=Paramecium primaurelia TaxID=5886 RepID=A0A8S1N7T5_PARPR|nr:unnamed protein product [Paramecium primaurelia]